MKSIAYLLVLLTSLGMAASPELQLGQVVPEGNWSRSSEIEEPEVDYRMVSNFDKPELKLKWAIVSGDHNGMVDRVRARVLFNGEKWIDLYKRKNGLTYGWNQVGLREIDEMNELNEIGITKLPDLRIAHWGHDKLVIKFTPGKGDVRPTKYFQFDLSQSLSN